VDDKGHAMRCAAVRQAIVDALEAIEPDVLAHAGDVFRETRLEEAAPVDRTFDVARIAPQSPAQRAIGVADPYQVTFEVSTIYQETPTAAFDDRLCNDGDLVVDALRELPATHDDIHLVTINGASDAVHESGAHVASWTVETVYDRRT